MGWIKNPKDFWSGVLFMVVGIAAILLSSRYPMGSAARMGPGYFPRGLGGLLMFLGALVLIRGLRIDGEAVPRFVVRPLVFVLVTVVVFGIVVPYTGVLLGTVGLIFITSMASPEFRWKEALLAGVLLAALAVAVFIVGLKLQLPIWPSPMYALWPNTFHQ